MPPAVMTRGREPANRPNPRLSSLKGHADVFFGPLAAEQPLLPAERREQFLAKIAAQLDDHGRSKII
jgi:hypothetical protein